MSRNLLIIALLIVVVVIAGIAFTRARVLAVPEQPLPFSHQTHTEAGLQCLFCHSSAPRTSVAGIPSVQKCMGCHNVIAPDMPAIQRLTDYWERGEPIPWMRVNTQPEFVGYSHQPHLRAGINCETCHGDVSRMGVARPVVKMDMGWCLDCHLEQPKEKVGLLVDCLTCHK